jgi:AraC-like DNA-binding protein
LNESVDPIYVRDVLIGYAMIGQFRTRDTIAPHVREDFRRRFGDDSPILEAFSALPTYNSEGREHIIGLFRLLVEYVVSKELIAVEGSLLVERVKDYVARNVERKLSLSEVARAVDRSPSTVSHAVKQQTGRSFKRLCMETRIERAEALMKQRPGLTVGELAHRLGYQDQFYFSRVYKKVRGFPPSRFLAQVEPPSLFGARATGHPVILNDRGDPALGTSP